METSTVAQILISMKISHNPLTIKHWTVDSITSTSKLSDARVHINFTITFFDNR